jgi:hypothetical protein
MLKNKGLFNNIGLAEFGMSLAITLIDATHEAVNRISSPSN